MSPRPDNVIPITSEARTAAQKFGAAHDRELLTILFTDLVDSTKLQSELGNSEAARLTELHRDIIREELTAYDAREIEWAGDSCLAVFSKPSDAIVFALRMLAEHRKLRESEYRLPHVRVGMHLGEIVVKQRTDGGKKSEDLFGLQVSEASRVMSVARGDQIYCTRPVFDSARASLRGQHIDGLGSLSWTTHGQFEMKGSPDPVEICEAGESDFAPLRPPEANEKCRPLTAPQPAAASSGSKGLAIAGFATIVVLLAIVAYLLTKGATANDPALTDDTTNFALDPVAAPEPKPVKRASILLPAEAPLAVAGSILNVNVAISPDGSRIAYISSDGTEAPHLVLRGLDQHDVLDLPNTAGAQYPFFSPDSEWLGFFDVPESRLKKISVRGGTPITVCVAGSFAGAHWTGDGRIVFSDAGTAIKIVSENGGDVETLTESDPDAGEPFHAYPWMLPGGNGLLHVTARAVAVEGANVVVINLETGERKVLAENASAPRYAPTGHIIYVQQGALMALPFDVDTLAPTGGAVPVTEYGMTESDGVPRHFGYSEQGTLVFQPNDASWYEERRLVWNDMEGNVAPLDLPPDSYRHVAISPDGRNVAAIIYDNGTTDVWNIDLARSVRTRFTFDSDWENDALWSPDGERIVFDSTRIGRKRIFSKRADGTGDFEELTEPCIDCGPESWARGGQDLIYAAMNPGTGWDVQVKALDSDEPARVLIASPNVDANAVVSPDGRWIAYQSLESGTSQIYVQPYPSLDGKWQISVEGGQMPVWAPDGSKLYYIYASTMYAVDVESGSSFVAGNPRKLFDGVTVRGGGTEYDIHPDGTRFLIMQPIDDPNADELERRQIFIVENWFEEVKRLAPPVE